MKTLTKKRGFFAAAAALLAVTVMLVTTWCSNDIGNEGYTDNFTPPPGKGAVRLNFDKKIARTILPDNATLNTFGEFKFIFSPNGIGTYKEVEHLTLTTIYNPIVLDPGLYDLLVIAYIDVADYIVDPDIPADFQPAATGGADSVSITAAKTTSAEIVLKPYAPDGSTDGTFKYKINSTIDSDNIISAFMNLTPIITGVSDSIDISSEMDDSFYNISVKAGYYYLDFVIEVENGETVTFRHIVHIYQNMTSSYAFAITPDYFSAVFQLVSDDLTYLHSQDKLPLLSSDDGSTVTPVAEGGTVEVEQGETVTIIVTNGTLLGFTGYEWYSQDDTCLETSDSFEVDATGTGIFNAKKTYLLTVVGVKEGIKYYTYIKIKVVAAS